MAVEHASVASHARCRKKIKQIGEYTGGTFLVFVLICPYSRRSDSCERFRYASAPSGGVAVRVRKIKGRVEHKANVCKCKFKYGERETDTFQFAL